MSTAAKQPDVTQLAVDRTWLAHERTLMAWIRTATAMISFAFTIYKFFEIENARSIVRHGVLSPRDFSLVMVSIALITLLLATVAHRREVKELSGLPGGRRRRSLAQIVAAMISVFGLLVLVAALLRE